MKTLFVDSGYLIALEASDDQNHQSALFFWQNLCRSLPPLLTTSYVFNEVVTFFNSRHKHEKAVEIGNTLIESSSMELIHVKDDLFYKAWEYFQKYRDKSFSMTDCVSFVIMKQHKIRKALTFDRHFRQAGFEILP